MARAKNEQTRRARHFRLLSASLPLSLSLAHSPSHSLSLSLFIFLSYFLSLFLSVFPSGSRSPSALLGFALRFFCLFSYSLVLFLVNRPSSFCVIEGEGREAGKGGGEGIGQATISKLRSFGLHFFCQPLPQLSYLHFSLVFLCWA